MHNRYDHISPATCAANRNAFTIQFFHSRHQSVSIRSTQSLNKILGCRLKRHVWKVGDHVFHHLFRNGAVSSPQISLHHSRSIKFVNTLEFPFVETLLLHHQTLAARVQYCTVLHCTEQYDNVLFLKVIRITLQ